MLVEIFKAILLTSLMGTALASALMLLRPFTKKYFSAGWHYYMWIMVLVVMVLPVRFNLPWAAQTELQSKMPQEATSRQTYHIVWKYIEATELVGEAELKKVDSGIEVIKNSFFQKEEAQGRLSC